MNRFLEEIKVSANCLDFSGCPVASNNLYLNGLQYLSPGEARSAYERMKFFLLELEIKVLEGKEREENNKCIKDKEIREKQKINLQAAIRLLKHKQKVDSDKNCEPI